MKKSWKKTTFQHSNFLVQLINACNEQNRGETCDTIMVCIKLAKHGKVYLTGLPAQLQPSDKFKLSRVVQHIPTLRFIVRQICQVCIS